MGTKYVTEAISGYDASPPVDDGSATEANKVKWSTTKNKLSDPLKTQVANIDTKLLLMADVGPDAKTATYTTVAADHQVTIECDGTFTVTLLSVASAPDGYTNTIKNIGTGTITVDATGTETIDGSTSTIALDKQEAVILQMNQAKTGYSSLAKIYLGIADTATSPQITITDSAITLAQDVTASGSVSLPDSKHLYLGAGNDLDISHDGTTTLIQNSTGQLQIKSLVSSGIVAFYADDSSSASKLCLEVGGATPYTRIYYDGTEQITTASGGPVLNATPSASDNSLKIATTAYVDSKAPLNTKIIDIGDWDMVATTGIAIAHGLTQTDIRTVEAFIRPDSGAGSTLYPIDYTNASNASNGRVKIDSLNVTLSRVTGGDFDGTSFDATSYNRGWITIHYI